MSSVDNPRGFCLAPIVRAKYVDRMARKRSAEKAQQIDGKPSPKDDPPPRHTKVMRVRILKPADQSSWKDLSKTLRDVRYRVFRLANLAVSENYLRFHLFRSGKSGEFETEKPSGLNKRLREMLIEEGATIDEMNRFSKTGALPDTILGALTQYKIGAITSPAKWREVVRGKASLPTFRSNMAIPIRCDKVGQRRMERMPNGDIQVELMLCMKPYPRVILQTGDIGGSAGVLLARLLDNPHQLLEGYRQRLFEIKHDDRSNKWWLFITYDFPATKRNTDANVVVGVDVGYSCPLYAAISNGHARLGWKAFHALGTRIKTLQRQVMARRRGVQRGGATGISSATARSGHGRKRKLQPIEILEGRINKAYNTLNHQMSAAVVDFALNHGAGTIQMEDLAGLSDHLRGTFIGASWRYHQLQEFIEYKAKENGMRVRRVNPRYTSRRCSECGTINAGFDRAARDKAARPGFSARFQCIDPECALGKKPIDADYNAARNLAVLDIDGIIAAECKVQKLDAETDSSDSPPPAL